MAAIAILVLFTGLMVVLVLWLGERRQSRMLAERIEDFLQSGRDPLPFSVRENHIAPLHNAVSELEHQLLLARALRAEESGRTSNLTADISHQLKTPLAALRLYCEMDASEHLDGQIAQIDRMERLIFALLRLERLYSDGYRFEFHTHEVAQVLSDAWQSVNAAFPAHSLVVTGSAQIRCDEKWLSEALGNLLKNACEHSPAGSAVRVKIEKTTSTLFVSVEDAGGGVDPRELGHLFERFYRASGSPDSGSGLGLAISREIIRRHHGSIHAENTGDGLRMNIAIPIYSLSKS